MGEVVRIRRLVALGWPAGKIAGLLGISTSAVSNVRMGHSYARVKWEPLVARPHPSLMAEHAEGLLAIKGQVISDLRRRGVPYGEREDVFGELLVRLSYPNHAAAARRVGLRPWARVRARDVCRDLGRPYGRRVHGKGWVRFLYREADLREGSDPGQGLVADLAVAD